jgi:nicotinate-nucleotide adenylyltransferase
MTSGRRLGILGGTFDPIHNGHLAVARIVAERLGLDPIRLVPSHYPPHRSVEPQASAYHRFAMVALASCDRDEIVPSDAELVRAEVSYTSATLRRLHAEGWAALQIFFITGADAFAEIATWHEYPGVLELAHFVVVSRPGWPVGALGQQVPALATRMADVPAEGLPPAQLTVPRILLLDGATPDVSSTTIRQRAARGDSLSGLVPPVVEGYIMRQGLYAARRQG